MSDRVLKPGHNCWRIETSARSTFLVDGADYVRALRQTIARAQHTLFVIGWDIDSQVDLLRDEDADPFPSRLGDFLDALVSQRPSLQAYLLVWDFAMVYAADREWLPVYKLGWQTHTRMRFAADDRHPIGASHHQKIVVVDDAVAFVGSMDLTKGRWDTSAHRPEDARRIAPDGRRYPPRHEVQVMLDGNAARALGELARERWHRATGQPLPPAAPPLNDPWPPAIAPDATNLSVGIARTTGPYRSSPAIREVEQLYLDAIKSAKRWIYIENQYFTARRIGEALAARLTEPNGPEIVLVSKHKAVGWLEEYTMGILRAKLLDMLRAADRHQRFRAYYPDVPGLESGTLNVHAKLMVVDDDAVQVGSSNLNNRSMGLDTECDVMIEAAGRRDRRKAIAALRHRLLAEHLGATPQQVEAELTQGSLIGAVERLTRDGRTLRPLPTELSPEQERWADSLALADPERAIRPEELARDVFNEDSHRPVRWRLVGFSTAVVLLLGLAAAWRWTPLAGWVDLQTLSEILWFFRESTFTPLWVMGAYVVGGLVVVPVLLLVLATFAVFDSLHALVYSVAGIMLSATLTYAVGHRLGLGIVSRMGRQSTVRIRRRLARHGLLAVVSVRIIPVAPFSIVNLVAGASKIRFRDYALGTLMGIAPGLVAIGLFSDRLKYAVREQDTAALLTLAGVSAGVLLGAIVLNAWLRGRVREADPTD